MDCAKNVPNVLFNNLFIYCFMLEVCFMLLFYAMKLCNIEFIVKLHNSGGISQNRQFSKHYCKIFLKYILFKKQLNFQISV